MPPACDQRNLRDRYRPGAKAKVRRRATPLITVRDGRRMSSTTPDSSQTASAAPQTEGAREGMDSSFHINAGPLDAETYAVEPHGELDIATSPDLAAALHAAIESGRRFVVLDLGEVWFLDASTLGVMLGGHRRLENRGGRLVIVCSDPLVTRVFEITGLVDVLSVASSRREALSQARHFALTV